MSNVYYVNTTQTFGCVLWQGMSREVCFVTIVLILYRDDHQSECSLVDVINNLTLKSVGEIFRGREQRSPLLFFSQAVI